MIQNKSFAHGLKRLGATMMILSALILRACSGTRDESVEREGEQNGKVNGVAASTVEV